MLKSNNNTSPYRGWIIWFVVSLFYFYEYYLRTAPSVMITPLTSHYHLTLTSFGVLVAAYYYSYAPMQLVAGFLMDRFGGKLVIPSSIVLCLLGAWLFADGNYTVAFIGRLLMGAGSGFAYIGILYVATNWISSKHLALLLGLTQAIGLLGAIFGQILVAFIMKESGWQSAWIYAVYVGIALAVIIFLIIPKRPRALVEHYHKSGTSQAWKSLKMIFLNKQIWFLGIYGGLMFIPTSVFAMLWGVPFLKVVYGFELGQASYYTIAVFIGWIVGAPLIGIVSDYFSCRKILMVMGVIAVFILFACLVYINLPHWLLWLLLFFMGLCSGSQVLIFAIAKESNPECAKGSAIGVTNFLVFGCSALITPLLGGGLHWVASIKTPGQHLITAGEYRLSMLLVLLSLALAFIFILFVKDKNKIQKQTRG